MSIREMRSGDTIIGIDGHSYEVEDATHNPVKARELAQSRRLKTFYLEDLECLTEDDGLWQETQQLEKETK